MKHRHGNKILSRTADKRRHLLQNLSAALLQHRSIITAEAKGKELKKWIEPLITEARKELTLARRRNLLRSLLHKDDLPRLTTVAKATKNRPGGYLRLTKLPVTRGDGAHTVRVEFVDTTL